MDINLGINCTVKDGPKTITIVISKDQIPWLSKSGKTDLLATTGGFKPTGMQANGQPVSVSLNVTVPHV